MLNLKITTKNAHTLVCGMQLSKPLEGVLIVTILGRRCQVKEGSQSIALRLADA